MVDKAELMWAAGLFEGEGCITLSGRSQTGRVSPRLVLSSADIDVIQRFHRAVACGVIELRPLSKKNPAYKDQHAWRVNSFEHVQATLAKLWGGLGQRRRARAVEILSSASKIRRFKSTQLDLLSTA